MPVIVTCVVEMAETYAPVVPVAAAVLLAGVRLQELGAVVHVVPKLITQAVKVPVPAVTLNELSVPVIVGEVPQAEMLGAVPPRDTSICPP